MATEESIIRGICFVKASYKNTAKQLEEDFLFESWMLMFNDIDDSLFEAGLIKAIKRCVFPPTVADINIAIKDELLHIVPVSKMWCYTENTIKKFASYYDKFSNQMRDENNELIGVKTRRIAKKEYEDLPEFLKSFFGSYSELMRIAEIYLNSGIDTKTQYSFNEYIKQRVNSAIPSELFDIIRYFALNDNSIKNELIAIKKRKLLT